MLKKIFSLIFVFLLMIIFCIGFETLTFSDSTTSKNLTFTSAGSQYVNLNIPKDANVTTANLDIFHNSWFINKTEDGLTSTTANGVWGNVFIYNLNNSDKWIEIGGSWACCGFTQFQAFEWNGSRWIENNGYQTGLSVALAPRQIDYSYNFSGGNEHSIWVAHGYLPTLLTKYDWNGSQWYSNYSVTGLYSDSMYISYTDIEKDFEGTGTGWYLFIQDNNNNRNSFKWNGSSWIGNSTFLNGATGRISGMLKGFAGYSNTFFIIGDELVSGSTYQDIEEWNGTSWIKSTKVYLNNSGNLQTYTDAWGSRLTYNVTGDEKYKIYLSNGYLGKVIEWYNHSIKNLTIKSNNQLIYENLSEFNGSTTIDLNATHLNNEIHTATTVINNNVIITYNITSATVGTINLKPNITWTDILPPRYYGNKTNNTLPSINASINFNITWIDFNISSSVLSWNCSTAWTNITTIYQSGWNVTFVYNQTLTHTKDFNSCNYKFYANDSTNNWNETELFTLNINKQIPTPSVAITPKPALATNNLTATITYLDADNDTWLLNETKWYLNNVENTTFANITIIGSNNLSDGQTWTVSIRTKDTFNWSMWTNDSVVISDTTPPVITAYTLSQSSYLTSEYIKFSVNVTDALSPMDWCKFTMQLINYSMVKVSNTFFNYTHPFTLGQGTVNISFIYCQDISSNLNTTISNLLFTVTAPSGGSTGGGGGSVTVIFNQTNVSSLLSQYQVTGCYEDNFCDAAKGESWLNCPSDCQFSTGVFTDFFKSKATLVLRMLILVFVLGVTYLYLQANYPEVLKRWGFNPHKKGRDLL